MLNPYDGTLQLTIKTAELKKRLEEKVINNENRITYELPSNDQVGFVIITDKEDDVEPFRHPFLFKSTITNKQYIALDFRLYLKKNIEDITTLQEGFSDSYNGKLLLLRGLFTYLEITEPKVFSSIEGYVSNSLGIIVSGLLTRSVHDNTITDSINVLTQLHYLTLGKNDLDLEEALELLDNFTLKRLHNTDLKPLYTRLKKLYNMNDIAIPSVTIGDLVNNIKLTIDSPRLKGLNSDVLIGLLNRGFYCLSPTEMVTAMIESKPTTLAVMYLINTESINKRMSFKKAIDSMSRVTKGKEIAKTLDEIIKDNIRD